MSSHYFYQWGRENQTSPPFNRGAAGSAAWEQTYGHGVLIAETFVDPEHFRGTTYKASGWTLLGQTQGFQRSRQDFYQAHHKPKQLWVRELTPGARTILRGRNLPAACQ